MAMNQREILLARLLMHGRTACADLDKRPMQPDLSPPATAQR